MSNDTTPDPEKATSESGESPNAKRMREQLEATQAENATLKGALRMAAFKEAGLDPEQKGLSKAIYQTYDGEPNPEAIKAFAREEYGWEPKVPDTTPPAQQRIQSVMGAGTPEDPPNRLQQAEEAAAQGDWVKSMALKDRELLAIAQRTR